MMPLSDNKPAQLSGESFTRWLAALSLVGGVISLIVILDYSGYPFELDQFWIFEYHLRSQDVSAAALLMALVIVAYFSPARRSVLGLVDEIARRPWTTAAVAFAALCLGTVYVEHNHPLAMDEYAALFQSRIFAAGRLTGEFPPDLVARLIPPMYLNQFIYGSIQTGQVASSYWPGFALLLAPFSFIGAPWACNPLLASLALVLMGKLASRLTGDQRAGGWAMLLALASPGFTGMAITYFSMTAHLLLNVVFVWLLLELSVVRLVLAGLVGSFALVLHNPVPHALFALPWIVWITRHPDRYGKLLALAAGYVPLILGLGLGWALLLSDIQGNALAGILPFDDNPLHQIINFFWSWHIKLRSALPGPNDTVIATRVAELVRLWNWSVPGLLILAAAGWWAGRRNMRISLLAASFACMYFGYFAIGFTQGHGWGARYLHPALGVLPVLGAAALVLPSSMEVRDRVGAYVASLSLLSLVLATALRAVQIYGYFETHLANRPAAVPGKHQVILIRFDKSRYTADLIQNDPFLRNDVWYMFSYGPKSDRALMASRFPGARLVREDRYGEVWVLDRPPQTGGTGPPPSQSETRPRSTSTPVR